ncbi:MAG: hypothetical protein JWN90_7 [Parcubacteria group bacterium]|nr:hypothetical protein [Parcubacteria group bacterium]
MNEGSIGRVESRKIYWDKLDDLVGLVELCDTTTITGIWWVVISLGVFAAYYHTDDASIWIKVPGLCLTGLSMVAPSIVLRMIFTNYYERVYDVTLK